MTTTSTEAPTTVQDEAPGEMLEDLDGKSPEPQRGPRTLHQLPWHAVAPPLARATARAQEATLSIPRRGGSCRDGGSCGPRVAQAGWSGSWG
eukprot:1283888-Pyramimonas_sp.AAC.1